MRYLLYSIGLVCGIASASVAYACPVTDHVSQMADLDPVSQHFVQITLDRVNAGLTSPQSSGDQNTFGDIIVKRFWNFYAQGAVNASFSVETNSIPSSRSLEEQTSCLRIDTQILESKLEEMRCELNTAYQNGDGQRMFTLRSVMFFLQDRISELQRGALDPFYSATNWGRLQWFDPQDQVVCMQARNTDCPNCCTLMSKQDCANVSGNAYFKDYGLQTCLADGGVLPADQEDPGPGLCPFTTNYLPPTTAGYGCDTEALEPILNAYPEVEPFRSEYSALEALIEDRNAFIELAEPIKTQREQLDQFTGNEPLDLTNFGLALEREHKEVAGCIAPTLFGEDDEFTLQFNPLYSSGATFTEPRGPFSFNLDEPKISRLLISKILNREAARALPQYLQTAYEQRGNGEGVLDSVFNFVSGLVYQGFQYTLRPLVQKQSANQALHKAELLGMSQDMLMQIQESYAPLRESIGGLSRGAATKDEGIRLFGINFAWYLRRSCTDRPCNETLDRVLKILFEDDCFPYTNGEYEGIDSFERCKDAAEL